MVGTGTGRSDEVVDGVRDIEGVVEAHIVAGEFDVVAEAVAEELCETLTGLFLGPEARGGHRTRTYIPLE